MSPLGRPKGSYRSARHEGTFASAFLSERFDPALLSRIEDAGINASAAPQQRWLDGWLVRFAPVKAKRARCVNAVAVGRLPIEHKLALCEPVYRAAALPLFVRITPFSQPPDVDARLAEIGMHRIDDTRVMVLPTLDDLPPAPLPDGLRIEPIGHLEFAHMVGELRGSPPEQRVAQAERLAASPVPFQAFAVRGGDGRPVACGQFATESELVGLYDVFTAPPARGRGVARALCAAMLARARTEGARVAYLQVEGDNHPARGIYHGLGFTDAYAYHYRTPDPANR